MDSGVIITAIIFIALISLPFLLINLKRRKIKNRLIASLKEAASLHQCTINKVEVCGNYAIGMDEKGDFIFFRDKSDQKAKARFINLAQMQSCEMSTAERGIKTSEGVNRVIDQLSLNFIPKPGNGSPIEWVFFHAESHMQLNGELQSIEKWSKLIEDRLKSGIQ